MNTTPHLHVVTDLAPMREAVDKLRADAAKLRQATTTSLEAARLYQQQAERAHGLALTLEDRAGALSEAIAVAEIAQRGATMPLGVSRIDTVGGRIDTTRPSATILPLRAVDATTPAPREIGGEGVEIV